MGFEKKTGKIKTGRFDGQPDWMPDCKMVKGKLSTGHLSMTGKC